MTYWQAFLAQTLQAFIVLDQAVGVLLGYLSMLYSALARRAPPQTHMADETISAMLYRKHRDKRVWGTLLMDPVNWVFSLWQRDESGQVVYDHCFRAYEKERHHRNLPGEYQTG